MIVSLLKRRLHYDKSLTVVALMTVKYHSVNVIVIYYRTIVRVLSHYHKDMIVIEPSHIVLAVFESVCRRISVKCIYILIFINDCVRI